MNIQVTYVSRGGHTKALAQAVAKGAGVTAQPLNTLKLEQRADILFVGAAVYAGKLDAALEQFLRELSAGQVGKIVAFTNSLSAISILPLIKPLLEGKGIELAPEEFRCKGQFLFFNRRRPNAEDLQQAQAFAVQQSAN